MSTGGPPYPDKVLCAECREDHRHCLYCGREFVWLHQHIQTKHPDTARAALCTPGADR